MMNDGPFFSDLVLPGPFQGQSSITKRSGDTSHMTPVANHVGRCDHMVCLVEPVLWWPDQQQGPPVSPSLCSWPVARERSSHWAQGMSCCICVSDWFYVICERKPRFRVHLIHHCSCGCIIPEDKMLAWWNQIVMVEWTDLAISPQEKILPGEMCPWVSSVAMKLAWSILLENECINHGNKVEWVIALIQLVACGRLWPCSPWLSSCLAASSLPVSDSNESVCPPRTLVSCSCPLFLSASWLASLAAFLASTCLSPLSTSAPCTYSVCWSEPMKLLVE